ncbi:MAG: RagB/SusD family nutrient uptake outer membrane protein [Duncaniella sp.]|nr:RagB/SusD family nutrient uptake outer membrane protein [Duncaniella sp.]
MLSQLPDATGDSRKKARVLAQAHVLRAWFHFLAVNIFAAQYDEATAASTGGVAYVDNTNNSETKTKLTVAQVYERILEDCSDEYLEQLSKSSTNDTFDFEADFGYAVRAYALFQMKRYEEAAVYAKKAIAVNPVIDDRSAIVSNGVWELPYDAPNHYMFIMSNYIINFSELGYQTLTPEFMSLYEDGDYLRYYSDDDEWTDYDEMLVGAPGSMFYVGQGSPRINVWGLRSEQIYYLLAESLIRSQKIDEGLDYVDQVRRNRIHPSKFTAYKGSVTTEKDAMDLLIPAKRVECVMTISNFLDCKRRNSEPEYAADVLIDNGEYGTSAIKPGSKLWIYPFPMNATNFNSTLTQNIK